MLSRFVASQIGTEVIFFFSFIKVLKTTEDDINWPAVQASYQDELAIQARSRYPAGHF